MGKQIYFTDEEATELMWIIPQFKDLHEDTWEKKEAKVVNNIIRKLVGLPTKSKTK